MVMMAWGYFYLLAGIALFIVPEYTIVLGINRAEASVLMGVLGVAIGVGCAAAGLISGHRIEPRLIPIGAAGLIIFFALLAAVPPSLPNMAADGTRRLQQRFVLYSRCRFLRRFLHHSVAGTAAKTIAG